MEKSGKKAFSKTDVIANSDTLLKDIRTLIEETRRVVAVTVNAGLTLVFWRVGKRILQDILIGVWAEYGKEILPTLSAKLCREYGRGWSERNLAYMEHTHTGKKDWFHAF